MDKRDRTRHQMVQAARSGKLGLIKLTSYLLDHQLRRLQQDFLKDGGLRERMTRARLSQRASQAFKVPKP